MSPLATLVAKLLSSRSNASVTMSTYVSCPLSRKSYSHSTQVINTVNFSNHSAYHHRGGSKTTPAELEEIFAAMESNGLLVPGTSMRLLTGYTPNAESLETVGKLARRLREGAEESEGLIYLLDRECSRFLPGTVNSDDGDVTAVLGDSGRLYVSPDCISVYRSMLPLATIITPNWFEVEYVPAQRVLPLHSIL